MTVPALGQNAPGWVVLGTSIEHVNNLHQVAAANWTLSIEQAGQQCQAPSEQTFMLTGRILTVDLLYCLAG